MDILDSRALRYTNCYIQKFSTPDTIHYYLAPHANMCLALDEESAFTIDVAEQPPGAQREGQQHTVTISRKGNQLVAEPAHLKIQAGDAVLWCTSDSTIQSWAVEGEGKETSFSSAALTVEAVYTHVFGTPGEYKWVDANGGRVSGAVRVQAVDSEDREQCREWRKALEQGTVVLIEGDRVEPQDFEIMVGQTVFWAVQKAEGISITDVRFARRQQQE